MGWLQAVGAIFGFLGGILNWIKDITSRKRKAQTEALKEIKEGFDENDVSEITSGFDNLNNTK